jgi:hypothetical protein
MVGEAYTGYMDENKEKENDDSFKRKNRHFYGRIYPAIWLIVIGVFFLLENFGFLRGDVWGKLWPIFIILPGLFILFRPRR